MSTPVGSPSVSSSRPGIAAKPLRLLAVEDIADDHELMVHALKRAGFDPHAQRVESEQGLREALATGAWDAVISDHNLPGFGSREALAIVRASGYDGPFIIVSGAIGEEVAVDAMRAGADDYVMKNNLARLAPALERSLRSAEERRARQRIEARIAGIADNIPGGMLQLGWSASTGILRLPYVAEAVGALFGVGIESLQQDGSRLLDAIDPDDRVKLVDQLRVAAVARAALRWEGRTRGPGQAAPRWVLLAASPRPGDPAEALWDGLVLDITHEKETEQELRTSRESLRELSAHVDSVREAERAELARELHDEFGGLLTGLKSDAAWLTRRLSGDEAGLAKVRDMLSLLEAMMESARRMARAMRPAILDQGITAALEWLSRDFGARHGLTCTYDCNLEEFELDPVVANTVFRAVQEALTNIARHAKARKVQITVFAGATELSVEVRDDGGGLAVDARAKRASFGLRGIEERVARVGGWMEISGSRGEGTTLMLGVPRAPAKPAP